MLWLKNFFKIYIHANIHVAIAAFCLVKISLLAYDISEDNTAYFVFFATLLSYNLIRFFSINKNLLLKNKVQLFEFDRLTFTLLSVFGLIYFGLHLSIKAILILLPFSMLTFLYGVPLSSHYKKFRNVRGLKIFLIAISYTGVTVLFPLVQQNVPVNEEVFILAIQRFLFVLIITLPFDIRDVHDDSPELETIPQKIGIHNSIYFGLILIIVFVILELTHFKTHQFIVVVGVGITSALLLFFSKEKQKKYYASFWVEGVPILWFIALYYLKP